MTGEGDIAPCLYCSIGNVVLDYVENDARMTDSQGNEVVDVWAEGDCDTCKARCEYDYDPIAHPHRPLRKGSS